MSPFSNRTSDFFSEWRIAWSHSWRSVQRTVRNFLKRVPFIGEYVTQEERIAFLEERLRELYRNHQRLEARLAQLEEAHTRLSERFSKLLEIQQYTEKRMELLRDALNKLFESHEMSEERFRLIENIMNDLAKFYRLLQSRLSNESEILSLPDVRTLSEEGDVLWIILRVKKQRISQNMFSPN